MTETKFNKLFIDMVIKPNVSVYIRNGYVDRTKVQDAYSTFKRNAVLDKTITNSQEDKFILSNNEITKNKLQQ
jgi:hypothetical protein